MNYVKDIRLDKRFGSRLKKTVTFGGIRIPDSRLARDGISPALCGNIAIENGRQALKG